MAQQESGWVLEQQPDPETFRRVWARVMPDGEGSPIALERERPEKQGKQEKPQNPPEEKPTQEREPGADLEQLIDRTRTAADSAQSLTRRAGRYSQSMGVIAAEDRTALRRFSAAYYLETGRAYMPPKLSQNQEPEMLSLAPALRRQYQREEELEGLCIAQMKRSEGTQAELLEELSLQFRRHCRTLRQTLERLDPDRLDPDRLG